MRVEMRLSLNKEIKEAIKLFLGLPKDLKRIYAEAIVEVFNPYRELSIEETLYIADLVAKELKKFSGFEFFKTLIFVLFLLDVRPNSKLVDYDIRYGLYAPVFYKILEELEKKGKILKNIKDISTRFGGETDG